MCAFYAYEQQCPDELEFGECQFQHDPNIRLAHKTGMNMELSDIERAEGARKLIYVDNLNEQEIEVRCKLLKFWPKPPTEHMIKNAKKQIEQLRTKQKFQKEAEERALEKEAR